jgi:DMSO/TMAO reductase YedYZ molybdopterin-dependent catalytic subunit
MSDHFTRRETLRKGLAATSLLALMRPWALPALADGEVDVPFTDLPASLINFNPTPGPERRILDVRKISNPITPRDQFFTTQHLGHPVIDPARFALRVSGLVERPQSLSLDELRKMPGTDLVFGFECSGNRRPLQGLCSNGRWTGVPLKAVLGRAGVKPEAREFVFFGADHGEEDVDFRGQINKVDQQYGRSLTREQALSPEPLLAYAMNGEPLTRHQGFPLRLLVPGWYGVAHVKWLSNIHVQEEPYLGKFQARWYRTLKGEMIGGEMKWVETAVTRMQLKSFIARVTRENGQYKVLGVALNDGTPLKSIEVRIDDGPWQPAVIEPVTNSKYSWKLFVYVWKNAAAGEHTLVSRVTDVTGKVQPTTEDLVNKKTFLEDNSQYPRRVTIS